ncbi:MAG: winged helix-turn-helix transcriptional regulator [Candidatus Omnitrophota bacterium]|nr:winged helix-turn-helix transcriptional regulator [Candidatus Omnitrophota bacterium]
MPDTENSFLKPSEDLKNFQLLEEVSRDCNASQRKLSRRLGVALGVTNACLKKMVKKGYIKIKGINHKQISYYLTPEGFSEKSRLTYHFLEYTVNYYIRLKNNISSTLAMFSKEGIKRVVYYGAGEVMEVAFVTLHETDLELLGIIDDDKDKQGKKMFSYIIHGPESIKELKPDAVIITSIRYRDKIMQNLRADRELDGLPVYTL